LLRWIHLVHERFQQRIPRRIQEPDPDSGRNGERLGLAVPAAAAGPDLCKRAKLQAEWQGRIFVCRVSASTCGQ
jgi:hypothetical protein